MQQKGAENVEQAKNTILLVRGTAAEPAALSAFTAAQPDVQLQAISGLGEAGAALERLRPTLIVLQSDAPDAQALHRCAELAETAEAGRTGHCRLGRRHTARPGARCRSMACAS